MRMRSIFNYAARALFLPALLCSIGAAAQWTYVGQPGFSNAGISNWQKLRFHSNNTPYVSFNDDNLGDPGGNVMKFDGANWVSIGDTSFTPGLAHHSSFAFGNGDTLYFSFADGASFSRAAVMMYDGTDWISLGTNLTNGECWHSNIEVGNDGTPYLICTDNTAGTLVTKMYDGTSWVNMGTGTIPGGAGYASTAFNSSGVLHVAYQDVSGAVAISAWDGTAWLSVALPYIAQTGGQASQISLAFDSNDDAYVAYWNAWMGPPNGSVIKYDGTAWSNVGNPGFTGGVTQFTSMAIGANDTPYIAFMDQMTLGGAGSVMKFDGTNWVYVGSSNITGGIMAHTSLATDANGNPFVAFYDDQNSGRTSVMTYTICTAPDAVAISSTDTSICSGDTITLTVSGNLNDATDWNWYSGSCGGTLEGTGTTLTVAPGDTTTYYVSGTGGCVVSNACTALTINASDTVPTPTLTVNGSTITSSAGAGNQWYTAGAPISGANNTTYTVTNTGWYYTTVTVGNCSNTSDSVYVIGTGIESVISREDISIYPIPFSNTLNVRVNITKGNLSEWDFLLTDNVGRTVYTNSAVQHENSIDLEKLSVGIYFLTVQTPEGKATYKVIKQ